jgi:gamma-glutamyltranspeptidase / glutathione hydrolase
MGHNVRSVSGEDMGGVQILMFVADPAAPSNAPGPKQVAGYYRSGSDFRKDGQAVGW